MQELQSYMEVRSNSIAHLLVDMPVSHTPNNVHKRLLHTQARHVLFVPTLASGSGGGPEYFNPATAEGKWVRNMSFTFDSNDSAVASTKSQINSTLLNGDFSRLGPPGQPPTGWSFSISKNSDGKPGKQQWRVVENDAPPGSKSGRSIQCTMREESCKTAPPYPCESANAVSPLVPVTGGSVVKLIIWAKLVAEDVSGKMYVQITMNSLDAKGHGDSRSGAQVRSIDRPPPMIALKLALKLALLFGTLLCTYSGIRQYPPQAFANRQC